MIKLERQVRPCWWSCSKKHPKNRQFSHFVTLHNYILGRTQVVAYMHLVEVNEKCERLWEIYWKYVMKGFPISTILMAVLSVAQCWHDNGHVVTENLYRPFKIMWALSIFVSICVPLARICLKSYRVQDQVSKILIFEDGFLFEARGLWNLDIITFTSELGWNHVKNHCSNFIDDVKRSSFQSFCPNQLRTGIWILKKIIGIYNSLQFAMGSKHSTRVPVRNMFFSCSRWNLFPCQWIVIVVVHFPMLTLSNILWDVCELLTWLGFYEQQPKEERCSPWTGLVP